MGNPIVHFEIAVSNLQKGKDFYGQLFDWKITDHQQMPYGVINTGQDNIGGGLFEASGCDDCKPYVSFYIQVDDLAATLEKVTALGGKPVVPPTDIPGGTFAMFMDPDENLVGIWKNAEDCK